MRVSRTLWSLTRLRAAGGVLSYRVNATRKLRPTSTFPFKNPLTFLLRAMLCRPPASLIALALSVPLGLSSALAAPPVGRVDHSVKMDAKTEEIIEGALAWMASHQQPNGAWIGLSGEEQKFPVAITAYTLIAFLSAGNLPGEGPYGENVALGTRYLLDQVDDEGLIIGQRHSGQYMYFHSAATIALTELYGQAPTGALRAKIDKMVKVIIGAQGEQGGWRYRPISGDADISVTVLSVVALRAAKNSGLAVPQKTIDDAVEYVRSCHHKDSGGFAYQPGQGAGFARTAAAVYSLQVCGQYEDPKLAAASKYLFDSFKVGERWFTYGNFYAGPAHYMMGGDIWKEWYGKIRGALLEKVKTDEGGQFHWETDLDSGGGVGPVYSTAVYTMILALPYHYLPLYQR